MSTDNVITYLLRSAKFNAQRIVNLGTDLVDQSKALKILQKKNKLNKEITTLLSRDTIELRSLLLKSGKTADENAKLSKMLIADDLIMAAVQKLEQERDAL